MPQATGGITRTYSYDANGDLISRSDGMSITMNAQDQVASLTPPGGSAIAMTYTGPGEGERVKAGSTGYQFDGSGMSLQLPQGQSPITYTTTPDGAIISETLPGGTAPCPSGTTPCTYDYLSDGQGNVAGVTDTAGTQLLDSYSYDPLGTITAQTSGVPNAFTFQGWMYDASTGLYYMGAAGYYDPTVGMQTGCKDGPGDAPSGTEDSCGEDEGNAREDFLGGGRSGQPVTAMEESPIGISGGGGESGGSGAGVAARSEPIVGPLGWKDAKEWKQLKKLTPGDIKYLEEKLGIDAEGLKKEYGCVRTSRCDLYKDRQRWVYVVRKGNVGEPAKTWVNRAGRREELP